MSAVSQVNACTGHDQGNSANPIITQRMRTRG